MKKVKQYNEKVEKVDKIGKPKHILVVDDERMILYSLEMLLVKENFQVTAKYSAKDVITMMKRKKTSFDLLILDMLMAEISGLQLIDSLKNLKISIPIIAITGFASSELLKRLKERDIVGYILKPFHYNELLEMVRSTFKNNGEGPWSKK